MFPDELKSVGRWGLASRGDIEFQQDGNIVSTVWQGTKPVVMLSSQHDLTSQQLWGEKGRWEHNTGDVSTGGSRLQRSHGWRRFRRPVQKILEWSHVSFTRPHFGSCLKFISKIHTSFISIFPCIHKNLTYIDQRVVLAQQLIGNYSSRKQPGRPPSSHIPPPKRITLPHFPAKITEGRCGYCKNGRTV